MRASTYLPEFHSPPLQNGFAGIEQIGEAFGTEGRIAIGYLEVQVRFGAVSGVAEQGKYLAFANAVAEFYSEAAGLQVGVEGEPAAAEVEDYVVAADRLEGDGRPRGKCAPGTFSGMPSLSALTTPSATARISLP